jgi:hypothetical protein
MTQSGAVGLARISHTFVAGTSKRRLCRNYGCCIAAILANTVSTGKAAFALFRQGFATSFRPSVSNVG